MSWISAADEALQAAPSAGVSWSPALLGRAVSLWGGRARGRWAAMPTWFRTDALHGYAVRPPANGLQRVLYSQLPAFRIVRRPSR